MSHEALTPTSLATRAGPAVSSPDPTPILPPLLPPVAGEPISISLGWRFGSGGHLTDGQIIHSGRQPALLAASMDRSVYALTAEGELVWRARTIGPAYAVAALDDGRVAIGDDAGQVTLVDGQGHRIWRREIGSRVTVLRTGLSGGLLAGGWQGGTDGGGQLTLLSTGAGEGQVRWQAYLDSPISDLTVLPAPASLRESGEGLAIAASFGGEVRALDSGGIEVWRFNAGAPVTRLGVLATTESRLILVGVQDGRLLALRSGRLDSAEDNVDGSRLQWQWALGDGGPVWYTSDVGGGPDAEIIAGMGGAAPSLALISARGELLWRVATPSPVGAIVTEDLDGDGTLEILAGLVSGQIQAYDAQGRVRGSVHAGLSVWELEASGDGNVLALADVVVWQVKGGEGPTGGSWLPEPAMVPVPPAPGSAGEAELSGLKAGGDGAVLVFLGDVAPGRSMEAQLLRQGPAYPWDGLAPLLRGSDLAVANLECALATQGQPRDKTYLIRAHPYWGQTLVDAGLDLVSLANNHALDYGQAGLDQTLSALDSLDLLTVGAGTSEDAARARRPAILDVHGVRLAVLGYAAARWHGSVDVPATDRLAWARVDAVRADVQAVHEEADFVVVLLHAGTEYAAEPSPDQVAVAHAAAEAGADLVVGHHSHVTQTVERYGQSLIVYSLGDALFDIPRPAAMLGHLLRVEVTKEGLSRAEIWPFWIEDSIRPRLLDDGQGAPRVEVIYP